MITTFVTSVRNILSEKLEIFTKLDKFQKFPPSWYPFE